ncbi:PspA/IM30 family protein [Halalkalibacillus halophilus]|uniref:PspA/IM30 family protein n=1 Tax=Halalkalibacillus halophilus TaxID=392827 RepID=UPI0004081EF9|nr:PspA/IM30 family protein [Halalkalibacillus halophilus]
MSNIFTRMKNTVSADLHDWMDDKEQKNPIAMLNQHLRDSEKEVEKIRKMMDRQRRLRDEFTKEFEHASYMQEKREKQATVARKADEQSLYDFATREEKQYEEQANKLQASLTQIKESLDQLEVKYRDMKHKLKDMKYKRMELMGKENMIRMNNRMNQILSSDHQEPSKRFEEIDRYMETIEQRVNKEYEHYSFDEKIKNLEKEMKHEA